MTTNSYIEDIFIKVYETMSQDWSWSWGNDDQAVHNFYSLLSQGQSITENQSRYILKILHKHQKKSAEQGVDYLTDLLSPVWKKPFRVLDQSKKIWVEKNAEGSIQLAIKMPFSLKADLEKIMSLSGNKWNSNIWDRERSVRLVDVYEVNLVSINEFVEKHKFEVDQSFSDLLSEVEEIWQRSEEVIPYAVEEAGVVTLKNATDDASTWWQEHRSGDYFKDIFTAKSAGYKLVSDKIENSLVEKISSSNHTQFWIKTNERFFDLYKKVGGPVAVLVSKSASSDNFVKKFVIDAEKNGVNKSDIRVCYRQDKEENTGFNQWVKDSGLGGKVEDGKIFIFQNRPPKWLFSQQLSVTIILTNSCFPVPSNITQHWMHSHPCVCFVGELGVSNMKEKTIVDL